MFQNLKTLNLKPASIKLVNVTAYPKKGDVSIINNIPARYDFDSTFH